MNAGNKSRGQADGFLVDALSKTSSIKDVDGNPIIHTICKTLAKDNEEFMNFKQAFEPCYQALKAIIADLVQDCDKASKELTSYQSQFQTVLKVDPATEELPFGKQISKFMVEAQKDVDKMMKQSKEVEKQYTEICDFFMIGKSDEIRQKSDKFFKFFIEFIDSVQKNMPKPEKKKPVQKLQAAAKKAGMASMMAELQAKQAAMKK